MRPSRPKSSDNTDLVVNALVQVLDEDVALARLAKSGVTLRPHDAAILLSTTNNKVKFQYIHQERLLISE